MLAMQGLDAAIDTRAFGERGFDENPAVIKLDGLSRNHRLLDRNRVAARRQCHELSTQTFMQMHQSGIDIIEARDEPQPEAIELRFLLLRTDQDAPHLIRGSLEQ